MNIWEKYKDLNDSKLDVLVSEMKRETAEKRLQFSPDTISFDDELKQYVLSFLFEDNDRESPYNDDIPEEKFRRRIMLALLKSAGQL